jgi:hypothetical protein
MDRPATVSADNRHGAELFFSLKAAFPLPFLLSSRHKASGFAAAKRRYTTRNPFSLPTLLSTLGYGLAWFTPMVATTKRIQTYK